MKKTAWAWLRTLFGFDPEDLFSPEVSEDTEYRFDSFDKVQIRPRVLVRYDLDYIDDLPDDSPYSWNKRAESNEWHEAGE